jgi:putative transcription antitermination factor YqgF
MSILAIDLWDKRCWLAIELEWIAIPKEIVKRQEIHNYISKYLNDYNIKTIVVWLPFDLYGKDLKQLEKTKQFIRELKNKYKYVKIEGIDERFTTFEAERVLDAYWVNEQKWQKDAISASLILESYLNKIKK